MDGSTPGSSVLHYLPDFAQIHVYWCCLTSSSSVFPFSFCALYFLAPQSFPMSQLFASSGQSIGASASAPVHPMNIQNWFPLGLSHLYTYISSLLIIPPPSHWWASRSSQSTKLSSLCYTAALPLAICFTHGGVYMSVLNPQFIPSSPSPCSSCPPVSFRVEP